MAFNSNINSPVFQYDLMEQLHCVIPTKITRLEPVFFISFFINKNENTGSIRIKLNPKLNKFNQAQVEKSYHFNGDLSLSLNNENINGYYIDGEIQLLEPALDPKCYLHINYGNSAGSAHLIKGNFKLQKN